MNKDRGSLKIFFIALCLGAALSFFSSTAALAQCAMCKSAVTNATSAAKLSRSLNLGTIILFIPPVTIFCTLFFVAYRKARRANPLEEGQSQSPGGRLFITREDGN
jgi:hypothetical protein